MTNASGITPVNDHLLVELGGQYQNIQVKEGKYDTQETGIVVARDEVKEGETDYFEWTKDLIGKRVWWAPMKEGTRVERDGKTYAFVAYDDVQGVEDVE